jgi:signal transduction histidine kinase/DNA-binding response OmpR family regulator/CHASE3 domain sensor protein
MKIISRPGVLRNLQIGFGLSLLLLIITAVASYSSIRKLMDNSQWVDHTDSVLIKIDRIHSLLRDAESAQRGYLLTGDIDFLPATDVVQAEVKQAVDSIETMTNDNPRQTENIEELGKYVYQPLPLLQKMIDQKKTTGTVDTEIVLNTHTLQMDIDRVLQRMTDEEHRLRAERISKVLKYSAYTPLLIVAAAVLSILITVVFYGRLHRDFLERQDLYNELQRRDADISRRIEIISGIADQISVGNYGTRISDEEKDSLGVLSGALNKMAESLEYSFGLLSDKEWLQTGIARLNEVMVGETDLGTLMNNIVQHVAEYSDSGIGAFYLLDPGTRTLTRGGHYGMADDEAKPIKVGDGLVGLVAREGKPRIVRDIRARDWVISMASGELRPRAVVAFPIFYERKVRGVIELGTMMEEYPARNQEFFTAIAENIGIGVHSIETRLQLQALLEETQAQAEELQSQHGELEKMNQELEVQAEKLQVSEEELKVQQEELMQTNQELEERSRTLEEKNQLVLIRNLEIQKKAEELALTTKYKSEFMANMSHELRTPLNSILLLSRLLAENESKNLSEEQTEYARVIQNSGQGLLELIDEILDLSKIESGKLQLEHSIVPVHDLLNDMRMLFAPIAKDKGLDLHIVVEEGTPAQLETDKMRLEQILKNLLSNAFKFTQRGSVTLQVRPGATRQQVIEFVVRDTGIGIPEDKHQLIFEAFQQADGSTRRKYGGTGLGLSISRELSRLLGGEIVLHSQPEQGSEFIVSVPVFKVEGVTASAVSGGAAVRNAAVAANEPVPVFTLSEAPVEIPDDRHGLQPDDKILLIVEDDTFFAQGLLDFSRKKGYKGIVAVSGDTAIRMARQYRPMGILLDIQLPVKNGWEVMEELKKDPQTRPIPVHIISSFEVKNESLMKGAVNFMSKGMAFEHMDDVFAQIESLLGKNARRVVIVEDNMRHAQALAYFLGIHNLRMDIASTIAQSAEILQQEGIHGVILSRETGKEESDTLEMIRQDPAFENIPVIVFTGMNISKAEEARLRQYADSIVVKTAHSYQRVLDEVSLFLHVVGGEQEKAASSVMSKLGALDEVLKNKVVLIADDDVRNIFSLSKALEQHKMKVLTAMDGQEALGVAESSEVDLVLMDMMMPEMDGFEAITRIRRDPKLKHLPIIAVTAKAMTGDRERCIQAGASDYISKPVDIDQLLSLLRIWLYEK